MLESGVECIVQQYCISGSLDALGPIKIFHHTRLYANETRGVPKSFNLHLYQLHNPLVHIVIEFWGIEVGVFRHGIVSRKGRAK